jgi:hypothetical protein
MYIQNLYSGALSSVHTYLQAVLDDNSQATDAKRWHGCAQVPEGALRAI